jgi:hypothetical protein
MYLLIRIYVLSNTQVQKYGSAMALIAFRLFRNAGEFVIKKFYVLKDKIFRWIIFFMVLLAKRKIEETPMW